MTTQKITQTNADKIITRLQNAGRKVDTGLAGIIFHNMFENKEFQVNYVGDVCDMYAAAIWNMGAVK